MNQKREYINLKQKVHAWLYRNFGKASKCENKINQIFDFSCKEKSVKFNWAKIKNKPYENMRENFMELCSGCHNKYDFKEETRKKLSILYKGKPSLLKGRKLSEEHRKRVSEALKGHEHSEETKKKISEALKGKRHTEETKRKISESNKGKIKRNTICPNCGFNLSVNTKVPFN